MSNIAFSTYVISGDKEELDSLYNIMTRLANDTGSFNLASLIAEIDQDNDYDYYMGECEDISRLKDGEIKLSISSDDEEPAEAREIIESAFPSLKIYYIMEETGMGVFRTNDVDTLYFQTRYSVEVSDEETKEFTNEDDALEYIEQLIGRSIDPDDNIQDALNDWAEDFGRDYACYNEYEVVED